MAGCRYHQKGTGVGKTESRALCCHFLNLPDCPTISLISSPALEYPIHSPNLLGFILKTMARSYENTTLCVRRGGTSKLSEAVMAKSTISEIPENHILIEVGSECYGSRRELSHLRKIHRSTNSGGLPIM